MNFMRKMTFWKRDVPFEVIDSLDDLERNYYEYDDYYFVNEELERDMEANRPHLEIVGSKKHAKGCQKDFDSHGCE